MVFITHHITYSTLFAVVYSVVVDDIVERECELHFPKKQAKKKYAIHFYVLRISIF